MYSIVFTFIMQTRDSRICTGTSFAAKYSFNDIDSSSNDILFDAVVCMCTGTGFQSVMFIK